LGEWQGGKFFRRSSEAAGKIDRERREILEKENPRGGDDSQERVRRVRVFLFPFNRFPLSPFFAIRTHFLRGSLFLIYNYVFHVFFYFRKYFLKFHKIEFFLT